MRGLETGVHGFDPRLDVADEDARSTLASKLKTPRAERFHYVADAFRCDMSVAEVSRLSGIDPWFLAQIEDLIADETVLSNLGLADLNYSTVHVLSAKVFQISVWLSCWV